VKSGRVPFVYILGAGHSGSTLLAMLMGRHPRICTIGEAKAPAIGASNEYLCSCGERMSACGFWRALTGAVEARGAHLDMSNGAADFRRAPTPYLRWLLKPLHRSRPLEWLRGAALAISPSWRRHVVRVQALNAAIAEAVCAITGKDVFVDSSKTGLQLKYLLENPALDVKVLRLVRDGRGVALSYRTADGLSMPAAAYAWRRSNEEAETIVSTLATDRWLDLRYEELCRQPERTMQSVFHFVGAEPFALSHGMSEDAPHVLGNDRARSTVAAVRLDERWRRVLTPSDLQAFDRVAGSLNRRFGYVQ
jgi:hypothetical protein